MHVKICKVIQPISHVRIYIARAHECIHIYGIFLVINLKQFRNSSLKKSAIYFFLKSGYIQAATENIIHTSPGEGIFVKYTDPHITSGTFQI